VHVSLEREADGGTRAAVDRLAIGSSVTALLQLGARTYFADALGLAQVSWGDGGTLHRFDGGAGTSKLVSLAWPWLGGMRAGSVWILNLDGGDTLAEAPILRADGGAQTLFDIGPVGRLDSELTLAVAAEEGLFAASSDGVHWLRLEPAEAPPFDNDECPAHDAGVLRVGWIDVWGGAGVGYVSRDSTQLMLGGAALLACAPDTNGPPLCSACGAGESLIDVRIATDQAQLWCRAPDGSQSTHTTWSNACESAPWVEAAESSLLFDTAVVGKSGASHSAHAGAHGQLWSVETWNIAPLTLDIRPRVLFLLGTTLWGTANDGRSVNNFPNGAVDYVTEDPEVGLRYQPLTLPDPRLDLAFWPLLPQRTVEGQLDQVFIGWGSIPAYVTLGIEGALYDLSSGTPRQYARYDLSLGVPTTATSSALTDGGAVVVAGFGDKLAAAQLGEAVAQLEVKTSPRPFDPIVSVALLPAGTPMTDGGALLASGWVTTANAVFALEARSSQHWRTSEVPTPDGRRLVVWTQGSAGRLGYDDGAVLSLPGRVWLASPIPGAAVVDYGVVCGQAYALTADALWKLEGAADGGIGAWTPVDLTGLVPGLGVGATFAGGALDLHHDTLFISTRFGNLVRLKQEQSCD
jgi:hypothetical protein